MKNSLLILILLTLTFAVTAQDLYISGSNQAEYIYKSAEDSLKNYFEDELNLTVDYKNLTFGITFNGYLPKYDENAPIQNLSSEDLSYEWNERFVAYSGDEIGFRIGTLKESFATGMVLRAYEDEDIDSDTRLEGAMSSFQNDFIKAKALYGVLESKSYDDKNDSAYGFEISTTNEFFALGVNALGYRELATPNYYTNRKVYGSNLAIFLSNLDFYSEYAYSELENEFVEGDLDGHALYANSNLYVGDFTLSASYKNFEKFNYRLNDLPTLNHNDEPLDDYVEVGTDEEGAMGEITWENDFAKLFSSYAEAWSSDFNYRLSNGFIELEKEFGHNVITLEYDHFERLNKSGDAWTKELTPAILADVPVNDKLSLHLKTEYQMKEEKHGDIETEHIEPLIQTDFMFGDYAFSLITEAQMEDLGSFSDAEYWVGAEFKAALMDNTDIIIFAGQQKGGKVCRNGACKQVQPFEGLKIEITTKF
ncbi:MAG: hypothetical protein B6226_03920 [Candidatus Cloacimonetes bacterium 4572_65]|nr:MAG: hypothetical protein B6226_03920 [Candidatus Cloacimonetes bacterium 4572_65]